MKQPGFRYQVVAHIVGAERIVGPRTMQEHAVHAGRVDDNGVGGADRLVHHHTIGQVWAVGADDLPDRLEAQNVSHFDPEFGSDAQVVQRQPGIGDSPTGGKGDRTYL